jgi:hypothetical protein
LVSVAGWPVSGYTGGTVVVVVAGTVVEVVVGGRAFAWCPPPQPASTVTPAAPAASPAMRAFRPRLKRPVLFDFENINNYFRSFTARAEPLFVR